MPQIELDPRWLSPDAAADFIGVARVTFYRLLRRDKLGHIRKREVHARAVFYWQPDLEKYRQDISGPPPDKP